MKIVRQQTNGHPRLPQVGTNSRPRKAGLFPFRFLPAVLALLIAAIISSNAKAGVITIALSTAPGGVTVSGAQPTYSAGFGNVNSLGIGSPAAGVTIITTGVAGGVIYSTNLNLTLSGEPTPHAATFSVYMSSNFSKSAALIAQSCYTGCGTGTSYSTISLNSGAPTPIVPLPGVSDGTYTISLGLLVADANGAGATTGTDSATVTFVATDTSNGKTSSVTLNLNNPSENLQTAVGLTLASAAGGLSVAPGADYSMDFGSVNGIGASPAAGLTIVPAGGGVIYSTPYLLQPVFSGFASTTATLTVYVSMDFVHPAILQLDDSAAAGGPYTAISKLSGAQTSITSTVVTNTILTRYLGLFVSGVNGPSAFTGSDSATLTYTLTVP
ncbi:MAG TPA: hypothetical protein VKV95_17945 [Terriglobia bacterium]|nr:hypothetical protein [Terriglobia bacterium]